MEKKYTLFGQVLSSERKKLGLTRVFLPDDHRLPTNLVPFAGLQTQGTKRQRPFAFSAHGRIQRARYGVVVDQKDLLNAYYGTAS